MPDLKATELTGPDGAPLVEPPTRRDELLGSMETALCILAAVREGQEAEKELNALDAPEIEIDPGTRSRLVPEPLSAPIHPGNSVAHGRTRHHS